MKQMPFTLPFTTSYRREDFITGAANQAAVSWIEAWPNWPRPYKALNLFGPEGAGKTHLGAIWRDVSGATLYEGLVSGELISLRHGEAVLLDGCDTKPYDEESLFHLFNRVAATESSILLLSRQPLSRLEIGLADTRSRLRSLPAQEISPPDDDLFKSVLMKLSADKQCAIPESVIDFLVLRIERSYHAAFQVVAALDAKALALKKPVTLGLARTVLSGREKA